MAATATPHDSTVLSRSGVEIPQKAYPVPWGPAAENTLPPDVGDEIGWRFAGLADGEGSFAIPTNGRHGTSFRCLFTLSMRADDRPFLEFMHEAVGLGRLYDIRPTQHALNSRPGTKPLVRWDISRLDDCVRLTGVFDRYPPLSRKGQDYAFWREAVFEWTWGRWERMGQLRDMLMASREFRVDAHSPARTLTERGAAHGDPGTASVNDGAGDENVLVYAVGQPRSVSVRLAHSPARGAA